MTLIIPPGFANAAFILTGTPGTQPYVTTLGVDTSAFGGDFVSAANTAMSAFATWLGPRISNELTLDRVSLAVGQDGPSGSVDSDLPPVAMTLSSTMAPTAMAVIARKVTNEIGRRGRGRMFIPGSVPAAGVLENGELTTDFIEDTQTALDGFYGFLTDDSNPATVLPPYLFHSQAPADPTVITGFTVQPLVGWVRGRIR